MKDEEKVGLAVLGGSLVFTGLTLYGLYRHNKIENEKHELFMKNMERQREAIKYAGVKIQKRIRDGKYDGKTIEDIFNDFKFEEIAYLEK